MRNDTQPLVSMHGNQDGTVPYGSATIMFLGAFPVMPVDGSSIIAIQANNLGILNAFHTWNGQDHVPYVTSQIYMDSTVTFVKDFLSSTICSPNFSIENQSNDYAHISLFPNPASGIINVQYTGMKPERYEIIDISGRIIRSTKIQAEGQMSIVSEDIPNGTYFLKLRGATRSITKLIQILH
jgi:hypothetical protein